MKKIPVFTSILLIAGVLATSAFSHPLVVRNGVVRGTSTGSFDLRDRGLVQTYILRQGMTMLPSGATLAAGDRVTVFADCFHTRSTNRSAGTTATANMNASSRIANENPCIALAVLVRSSGAATAAQGGAVPATGGTVTATSAPSTSGATNSSTPAASATSAASATPAAMGTPMVCPTATATGTPVAGGSGTPVMGTATATMFPCVTPTSTP